MKCEFCGQEHDGVYGSGRFCGQGCSRKYASNLKREEVNKKVSETLKEKHRTGELVNPNRGEYHLSLETKLKISKSVKEFHLRNPEFSKQHPNKSNKRSIGKYKIVWLPSRESNRKHHGKNSVYEHILVAEKMLGRYLENDECVHHKDGNKSNNDPKNLMVFDTKNNHLRYHNANFKDLYELIYNDGIYSVIDKPKIGVN